MKKETLIGLAFVAATLVICITGYSMLGRLCAAGYELTRALTTPQSIIIAAVILAVALKPKKIRR